MHTSNSGVLVVDLQPGYASASGVTSLLMHQVLAHLDSLPPETPIAACFVNEELSGDTHQDVLEFWEEHGASPELLARIRWTEKPYAFLRGWMDNGVPADEIVRVLQHLRTVNRWDSRDLPPQDLEALSEHGAALLDPLFREDPVDQLAMALRDSGLTWLTCGGSRDECLAEVELVLDAYGVRHGRLSHLTY